MGDVLERMIEFVYVATNLCSLYSIKKSRIQNLHIIC